MKNDAEKSQFGRLKHKKILLIIKIFLYGNIKRIPTNIIIYRQNITSLLTNT